MGLVAAENGWEQKRAGQVLGIHPFKVGQATRPALVKVARLMLVDPKATMAELLAAMEAIEDSRDEIEFTARERMLDGRLDRAYVHRSGP